LHAPHGSPYHQSEPADAKDLQELGLNTDLVPDAYGGEIRAETSDPAGRRTMWARRTVTATEYIGGHHEIHARIQGTAWAQESLPPIVDVGRSGKGVANESHIVSCRIQAPPCPKGHLHLLEPSSSL